MGSREVSDLLRCFRLTQALPSALKLNSDLTQYRRYRWGGCMHSEQQRSLRVNLSNSEFASEIEDWKRVRAAIEHENALTNQRVTWLLSSQGFLLGAFMLMFSTSVKNEPISDNAWHVTQGLLYVIALSGIVVALFLSRGVRAAFDQHNALVAWWKERCLGASSHPPICGDEPRLLVYIHYYKFPFIFIPTWILLIIIITCRANSLWWTIVAVSTVYVAVVAIPLYPQMLTEDVSSPQQEVGVKHNR